MTNHSILGNKLNQKTFVKHETWLDSVDLTEWCIIEPEKEFSHANLQVNFVKWTRCHLPGDNYRILILVAFLLFRKLWKASQKRFRFYFKRLATRKSWELVDGLHEFVHKMLGRKKFKIAVWFASERLRTSLNQHQTQVATNADPFCLK